MINVIRIIIKGLSRKELIVNSFIKESYRLNVIKMYTFVNNYDVL